MKNDDDQPTKTNNQSIDTTYSTNNNEQQQQQQHTHAEREYYACNGFPDTAGTDETNPDSDSEQEFIPPPVELPVSIVETLIGCPAAALTLQLKADYKILIDNGADIHQLASEILELAPGTDRNKLKSFLRRSLKNKNKADKKKSIRDNAIADHDEELAARIEYKTAMDSSVAAQTEYFQGGSSSPEQHPPEQHPPEQHPPPSPSDDLAERRAAKQQLSWRRRTIKNEEGIEKPKSLHNTILFIQHHPACPFDVRQNDFAQTIEVLRRRHSFIAPGVTAAEDADKAEPEPTYRLATDNDYTEISAWLETAGIYVMRNTVAAAASAVAKLNRYDPLKNFINALEWDGTPRLKSWIPRLLGADTTPYIEAVGFRFLIGAIARGLEPGCKMDTMLILEGPQGLLKSSAISALFGAKWFTDEIHAIGSKDAAMQLLGRWVIEIAEMHAMSRAESNANKEWMTRTTDKYRPPYGTCIVESPRRCVLVGTLNPEGGGYLKDPTGGRRFWPVVCHKIDLQAIKNEREQLFAEAKYYHKKGEKWWLTQEEEALARVEQEDRTEVDDWSETIKNYLFGRNSVTTDQILREALELNSRDINRGSSMRVAILLRDMGFKRFRKMADQTRHYYYERPKSGN